MDEMQELATALHTLECHSNHMDQCSWEYEENDWSRFAHKNYLFKAQLLYGKVPQRLPAIIAVVKALKGL